MGWNAIWLIAVRQDEELVAGTPKSTRLRKAGSTPTRASSASRTAHASTQQHHEGDRGDQPEGEVAPARAARFGLADFSDRSFG